MQFNINNVVQRFDLRQSGSLQYWELRQVGNEMVLIVAGQPFVSTNDHVGLENYRNMSLQQKLFVGPGRQVDEEWFACVVAQTRVADQRTKSDSNQFMGQLAVPVCVDMVADQIPLGIIELVTYEPKACYIEDFNQIRNLLQNESLSTTEKKIKIRYNNDTIKFSLPMASITYLWGQVTERLNQVNQKAFRIKYEYCEGKLLTISSNDDLRACIAKSSSMGETTIKMVIEQCQVA